MSIVIVLRATAAPVGDRSRHTWCHAGCNNGVSTDRSSRVTTALVCRGASVRHDGAFGCMGRACEEVIGRFDARVASKAVSEFFSSLRHRHEEAEQMLLV